jgi:hypothetical protein
MFLSRNRNPLFDMTNTKFWETGLISNGAKYGGGKKVKDHYIPRKIAMGFIMDTLVLNPNMSVDDFIERIMKISMCDYVFPCVTRTLSTFSRRNCTVKT